MNNNSDSLTTNHQKRITKPVSPFSESFLEFLAKNYTEHLGIYKSHYKSLVRDLRAMNKIVRHNYETFKIKKELIQIKNEINDIKCCARAKKLIS